MKKMRKMEKIIPLMSLMLCSITLQAANVNVRLTGGGVMPRLKNSSEVWVYNDLLNRYETQRRTSTGLFWGGGLDVDIATHARFPLDLNLGLAAYSIDFRHISGVKQLYVNQGTFDSSLYSFANKSSVALIEGRVFYTDVDWQPFILAGVGVANNKASHYQEFALGNSVANQNFNNATHHGLAYEAGFGLRHGLFQDAANVRYALSIDYRYINSGRAHLGPFAGQTTHERLHVENLQTDALSLTLSATV